MLEKLESIREQYRHLDGELAKPEIIADQPTFQKYAKTHSDLGEIVEKYQEYLELEEQLAQAKELLADEDPEVEAMAAAEIEELEPQQQECIQQLRLLLLPKDPRDERNVLVEVRAGTGGEEAALFAANLFRMYTRYAERTGWAVELMSVNETELGGFKEIIFMIQGRGAFSRLKYESGVHRVQRVPTTETGGRIHTSAATVAVLPEAEDVELEISPSDLRIDVYRSSGHGGQSVNTTDSAVRITHLPSGLVVTCQDEKSQLKNKDKALKILKARLLDQLEQETRAREAQDRRSQVGSGDRSERIRTYNFPQSRVTDHRIGLTLYQLEAILDGDINEIIDALITAEQTEQLSSLD